MTIYHLGKIEGFLLLALFPSARLIAADPRRDTAARVLAKVPQDETEFFYHLDVTCADVWPAFRAALNAALAARGIRVFNNVPDITRKTLQKTIAAAGFPTLTAKRSGKATEKLMVKPNFNFWGRADAALHEKFPQSFPRFPKTVTDFQVMERRSVPSQFWKAGDVQIERLILNRENKYYRVVWWNGRCVVDTYVHSGLVKRERGSVARWRFPGSTKDKKIAPVVKLARAVFAAMDCDFGTADILTDDDGNIFLCDLNPTPGAGEPQDEYEKTWTAAAVVEYLRNGTEPKGRGRLPGAPSYQFLYDLRLFGTKLENTFKLAALSGNPQQKLRFIHVAGTNGKGSTCAMLESIYRQAGLRVGLFTSPHLVTFRERIQINRQLISESDITRLICEIQASLKNSPMNLEPTFFELMTVAALKYFLEQKCDLVIWETGVGGRLDSTNIVTPLASVITNVQFDHQNWLGNTLTAIAGEKAGIIKEGVPIITSVEEKEALDVVIKVAAERNAPLTIVNARDVEAMKHVALSLTGEHQHKNAALACETVRVLQDKVPVKAKVIRRGLETANWDGRLQVVRRGKQVILLDGAHNPAGMQTLTRALQRDFAATQRTLIFGVLSDKDFSKMIKIIAPFASTILLCPTDSERSADPKELVNLFRVANPRAEVSVCKSLAEALEKTAREKFVVMTGSLHFIGEAIELLGVSSEPSERSLNEWGAGAKAR